MMLGFENKYYLSILYFLTEHTFPIHESSWKLKKALQSCKIQEYQNLVVKKVLSLSKIQTLLHSLLITNRNFYNIINKSS